MLLSPVCNRHSQQPPETALEDSLQENSLHSDQNEQEKENSLHSDLNEQEKENSLHSGKNEQEKENSLQLDQNITRNLIKRSVLEKWNPMS